jgi:hypothetical protein
MWTTSNFPADRLALRLALAAVALLGAGCRGSGVAPAAPDSPRPARDQAGLVRPAPSAGTTETHDRPVEIRSARPLAVRGDPLFERLAGAAFLNQAQRPVAVEVITTEPLGDVTRTASPEIYLNGERVADTWPLPPNRLIVFLPDGRRLRGPVSVTVAWLGSEERTRSRRAVVLTEEQLQPFR